MPDLGPILLCTAIVAAALAASQLLRFGAIAPRQLAAPVLGSFFLLLTQLPLPDRATMACPVPHTGALLQPLHTIGRVRYLFDRSLHEWLADPGFLAAVANLGLCGLIGMALSWRRGWPGTGARGWRRMTALAIFAPLATELTQLTGTWGLFPCAYRQFDVDDLILNGAGLLGGYALMRLAAAHRRKGSSAQSTDDISLPSRMAD